MAKVNKHGLMVLNMMASGKKVMPVELVNFTIQMGICMKVTGLMIKPMVKEFICIKAVPSMMGIGSTIFNMDMGKKNGQMGANTAESIERVKSMG